MLRNKLLGVTASLSSRSPKAATLAEFHPGIAGGWLMGSSRLATPFTEVPESRKLAWWRCSSAACGDVFQRPINAHCAAHGACRSCGRRPTPHQAYDPLPKGLRFRRVMNRMSVTSNVTRVRRSISDLVGSASVADFKRKVRSVVNSGSKRSAHQRPPPLNQRNLQPMLAHTLNDEVLQSIPPSEALAVSPKLDGVRCLAAFDPVTNKVVLLSRHGMIIQSCPHIERALAPLFQKDKFLVLDGEIYHHTAFPTFEELCGVVRHSKANDPRTTSLQYHLFDILETRLVGRHHRRRCPSAPLSYSDRYVLLSKLLQLASVPTKNSNVLQLVPVSYETVRSLKSQLLLRQRQGYEGVIVRRVAGPYAPGKRSPSLLKMKTFHDREFRISGVVEGTGKWKRALGAFLCVTDNGQVFHASPAVTDARRREMWSERQQFVGKMLTVQFQELTNRGVPRFPVGKAVRGSALSRRDWL